MARKVLSACCAWRMGETRARGGRQSGAGQDTVCPAVSARQGLSAVTSGAKEQRRRSRRRAKQTTMAEAGSTRLFVGNLPWSTEESQLLELFNSVRPCNKATIERGRQGRSRGFAIVEYPSAMDAMAAMQALNGES